VVDLLEALLQARQIDVALLSRVQGFPESRDSFITLIVRLAGRHDRDRREDCYREPGIIQGGRLFSVAIRQIVRLPLEYSGRWS